MSELPGTAAVGIESVEWLDAGGGQLTVRVTGRWRRRRPGPGGAAALILEAEGRRQRFPAMPEPPSIAGTAPGMWRLSFSIPGELAPGLGGRAWLALGTVTVPLPVPESAVSAPAPGGDAPPLAAESVPESEPEPTSTGADLEIERAWRRAEDAERASVQLAERIVELERSRRAAEQRAHAEEATRRDLARQLGEGGREAARARQALGELATAEERIRELEAQLGDVRRAGDEAERAAAAARAARDRAERRERERAELTERPVADAASEDARLRFEEAVRARRETARASAGSARIPAEPALVPETAGAAESPVAPRGSPVGPGGSPAAGAGSWPAAGFAERDIVAALRSELHGRVAAEAGLRARVVQAETRLAARVLLGQRTAATLRELGDELATLREALATERERRATAEDEVTRLRAELGGQRERSRDAYDAIGELRGTLDRLAAPADAVAATEATGATQAGTAGSGTADPVTPERLSDALARLREAAARAEGVDPPAPGAPSPAPVAAVPAAVGAPTVERAVRRLVARDADLAGRLVIDLLGAQATADPRPIAYDVVLGPGRGCVQVTNAPDGGGGLRVRAHGAARTREQVDFQVVGDPARLARLLTAGRLRRVLRVGIARVRGRREGLAAVRALLALPLHLDALRAAGMRLEPETLLGLVGAMIDPAWTRGERFTLAHVDERGAVVHLQVRDGRAPRVSRAAPEGRVATTLTGSAVALAVALAGEDRSDVPPATVAGDTGPLALLRAWIDRAQSG